MSDPFPTEFQPGSAETPARPAAPAGMTPVPPAAAHCPPPPFDAQGPFQAYGVPSSYAGRSAYSRRPVEPPANWGGVLVIACLALGVAFSWGGYELKTRRAEAVRMSGFRHDLDALDSRDRDLGALMADPRTKLVRLSPVDDLERGVHSPVRHASVAWNDARQSGVFFCDGLVPADGSDRYRLWLVPPAGTATGIELARPEPGRTVYPLSPEIRAPAPGAFVLTNGPGGSDLKDAGRQLAKGTAE